jgi:hypothetical protein
MSVIIKGGASSDLASVSGNKQLFVNLPTTVALNPGFAVISAEVTDGTAPLSGMTPIARSVRTLQSTLENHETIGQDIIVFNDNFNHATLNANVYKGVDTTMTKAVSGGFLTLNSGSVTTSGNATQVSTYRNFSIYGSNTLVYECWFQLPFVPQANNVIEWGLGYVTGVATPTDGVYFRLNSSAALECIMNVNGAETVTTVTSATLSASTTYYTKIFVSANSVEFYFSDKLVAAAIPRATAAVGTTFSTALPMFVREWNNGIPGSAQQMKIAQWAVTYSDSTSNKPWNEAMVGAGLNAIYSPPGVATATGTANYANSAAPAIGALSNTAASYTTLGGQWLATTVNSAETDFVLFGYTNPAGTATIPGRNLYINAIRIGETQFTGTSIGLTPTVFQWGVGNGGTAAALNTADSLTAGTRAHKRLAIGSQAFATTILTGGLTAPVSFDFRPPLFVEPGTVFDVILKIPSATNTATTGLGYRGTVAITGNFE